MDEKKREYLRNPEAGERRMGLEMRSGTDRRKSAGAWKAFEKRHSRDRRSGNDRRRGERPKGQDVGRFGDIGTILRFLGVSPKAIDDWDAEPMPPPPILDDAAEENPEPVVDDPQPVAASN